MAWTDGNRLVFLKEAVPYTAKAKVEGEVVFQRAIKEAITLQALFETLVGYPVDPKKPPSEQDPLVNASVQALDWKLRGEIAQKRAEEEDATDLQAIYDYLIPKGIGEIIHLPYDEQTTAIKALLLRAQEAKPLAVLQAYKWEGLLGLIEKRNQEMEACLDNKKTPSRPISSKEAADARQAFQRLVTTFKRLYKDRFRTTDPEERAIREGFFNLLQRAEA